MTKRIVDVGTDRLLNRDEVRKNGLFVLPTGPRKPRLSNIRLDEVKDYLRYYGLLRDKTEILEVSDIKDVRLRYQNDVVVVKLDAADGDKSLFAAYRAQQYLEDESTAIQRLADRGADLLPEDLKPQPSEDWAESPFLSQEESGLLKEINDLDQSIDAVKLSVSEAKTVQGTTQNTQERLELEPESKRLNWKSRLGKLLGLNWRPG